MAHGSSNGGGNHGGGGGGGNGGGNHGGGGGQGNGGGNPGVSAGQAAPGLPGWLTASSGGVGPPIAVSAWLAPDYPGGYAGWLNDNPNPGHAANPPDNAVYKAWLQQHVGSDGQLHLPPAGSPGTTSDAGTTPTPNPAATIPQVPEAPSDQQGGVTYPNGPGGPDYTDQNSTLATGGSPGANTAATDTSNPDAPQGGVNYAGGGIVAADSQGDFASTSGVANPASTSATDSNTGGSYTVVPGDTLSGIAAANGLTLKEIASLNPQVGNIDLIHPGQTINIGGGSTQPTASTTGSAAPAAATADTSAFPTTSTYPPTDSSTNQQAAENALGKLKTLSNKLTGWGGSGSQTTDPAQKAIFVEPQNDTNPLHIKDQGGSNTSHT